MLFYKEKEIIKYDLNPKISNLFRVDFSIDTFGFGTFSFYPDQEDEGRLKIDNENTDINMVNKVFELSLEKVLNNNNFGVRKSVKEITIQETYNYLNNQSVKYFNILKSKKLNKTSSIYLINVKNNNYLELTVNKELISGFININDFLNKNLYKNCFISCKLKSFLIVKKTNEIQPKALKAYVIDAKCKIKEHKMLIDFNYLDVNDIKIYNSKALLIYCNMSEKIFIKNFNFDIDFLKQIFNCMLKDATVF